MKKVGSKLRHISFNMWNTMYIMYTLDKKWHVDELDKRSLNALYIRGIIFYRGDHVNLSQFGIKLSKVLLGHA